MKIRHLDLCSTLRKAYRAAGHSLSYDHGHLTPEGNRIVAQTLDQFLQPLVVRRRHRPLRNEKRTADLSTDCPPEFTRIFLPAFLRSRVAVVVIPS